MDTTATATATWGPVQKAVFRFVFAYFALYLPVVLGNVGAPLTRYIEISWRQIVPWVGKHILQLPNDITTFSGGSGDTTYDWVRVLCMLWLAALVALLWTAAEGERANYERIDQWMRVLVRTAVVGTMIVYGTIKVIPTQFPSPSLDRLLQPFGDASPMGLLWTFIGASKSYTIFTGAAEVLGGLLLVARRTTALGALVCIGVMGNVLMMNMSYDVPVKLLSFHIVWMGVYLLAPDLQRVTNVLVFNRPAQAAELRPLFKNAWLHRGALALRSVLAVGFLASSLYGAQQGRKQFGDLAPRSPLYGIWAVEEFETDGKPRPPLTTDESRWKRVVFDRPQVLGVYQMNDSRTRYVLDLSMEKKALALTRRDDTNWKANFSFAQPQTDVLQMEGTLDGKATKAKLRRIDHNKKFLLLNRGFHWINEAPFNR